MTAATSASRVRRYLDGWVNGWVRIGRQTQFYGHPI